MLPSIYNSLVSHPLQSYEWGEFRKKTGIKIIREVSNEKRTFQVTIHKVPFLNTNIGYFPKGDLPTKEVIDKLLEIGREENCSYIQLEPNVEIGNWKLEIGNSGLCPAFHPLFTKYTFVLDLTKSEEELLKNMHQKTRYNIRIAQRSNVEIKNDQSDEAFKKYLKLTKETTKRQKFYAHSEEYHKKMWDSLKASNFDSNKLQTHLLLADYKKQTLVAWILFTFKDTLYYPYGASASVHREVMASNLMMWEAIRFGKNMGLLKFDMWGSLGPNPDASDPWFGFHKFKEGYGPKLVEFVGSFDLVINSTNYKILKFGDRARWTYLRLRKII